MSNANTYVPSRSEDHTPGAADLGCQANDLKGLLNAIVSQISDADRRQSDTLLQMQDRLAHLGNDARSLRARVPDQFQTAFERIEVGMAELAARIGVSQPAISQWESGREKPGRDSLQKLASAFDVSLDELCGTPAATPSRKLEPVASVNAMPVDVPVFGTAVGGEQGDFSFNGEVTDYVRRPQGVAPMRSLYALWVTGDSMAPWNCSGDLI